MKKKKFVKVNEIRERISLSYFFATYNEANTNNENEKYGVRANAEEERDQRRFLILYIIKVFREREIHFEN